MKLVILDRSRLRSLLSAAGFGLVSALSSGSALASESFPGAVQEYLLASGVAPACPPTCTLCHTSPAGGAATVRLEGFTENLRTQSSVGFANRNRMPPRALTALDPSTVGPAIQALETLECTTTPGTGRPCDSDNDGTFDVAELRAGTDPDGPGLLAECPQYGCGASVAPVAARPFEVPGAWLVAALGALVFVRRRR
jgi:MYXO-CTERM domain-containing protein